MYLRGEEQSTSFSFRLTPAMLCQEIHNIKTFKLGLGLPTSQNLGKYQRIK
jgi:hypothetical protein